MSCGRSLNRIQADEVTYNLHILIRFELEHALIKDDLKVADLPAAWNEAYQKHLGIVPANDAEGCLQDGHWSEGLIGYFPTYTLGNLFAAQLFARARTDLGDIDSQFAKGRFGGLLTWSARARPPPRQPLPGPTADRTRHRLTARSSAAGAVSQGEIRRAVWDLKSYPRSHAPRGNGSPPLRVAPQTPFVEPALDAAAASERTAERCGSRSHAERGNEVPGGELIAAGNQGPASGRVSR